MMRWFQALFVAENVRIISGEYKLGLDESLKLNAHTHTHNVVNFFLGFLVGVCVHIILLKMNKYHHNWIQSEMKTKSKNVFNIYASGLRP